MSDDLIRQAREMASVLVRRHRDTWPIQTGYGDLINEDGPEAAALLVSLADEVVRLREALTSIRDGHIPDTPMTSNDDELLWAQRWVGTLRRIAFDALAGEQGDDHE